MIKLSLGLLILFLFPCICIASNQSCDGSYADCNTKFASVNAGETLTIANGSFSWTSTLTDTKGITIQGGGIDVTTITLGGSFSGPAIRLYHSNSRVTGITFSCAWHNTSNLGVVQVGTSAGTTACNSAYTIGDWRVDHIKFIQCGNTTDGDTGYNAFSTFGYTYGVFDHNTLQECNGECLNLGGDGPPNGLARSTAYGGYANGTTFIEDNTWTYGAGLYVENVFDGNSAARVVFRHNSVTFTGASYTYKLLEMHGTEVSMVCDAGSNGDCGFVSAEVYNNDIYLNGTGNMQQLLKMRGGKGLVYNNTFHTKNPTTGVLTLANYRSFDYGTILAVHARGYSNFCHDADSSYTVEGRAFSKTTLNGTINTATCPTMAATTDFPTYGGSIMVGTEQIDYTGISGSQLTPCTRGANGTTAASHTTGAAVDLFNFGVCLEQINNTWVWGNKSYNGSDYNVVSVDNGEVDTHLDYSLYDIQSYAVRPANWQYRNDGTSLTYSAYTYPHPLVGGATPVNGVCGSNDSGTFASLTSGDANNCAVGTTTDFLTGQTPDYYTWTCPGTDGGTDDDCSASKSSPSASGSIKGLVSGKGIVSVKTN